MFSWYTSGQAEVCCRNKQAPASAACTSRTDMPSGMCLSGRAEELLPRPVVADV